MKRIRTRKGSSGDDWDEGFADNGCGISPNQSGTILTLLMMTIGFLSIYGGVRRQATSKKR